MSFIDFRSDTVTRPTEPMRQAMMSAELGDDVFGDDPTINALQRKVAALFGKEDALLVPSGTMGNQTAIAAQTQPGDEILFEAGAHIFHYEVGAAAVFSGVQTHPIVGTRGVFTADQVRERIHPVDIHCPRSRLVAIENTHQPSGGTIFPIEEIRRIRALCLEEDMGLHMDGARIWNAHVATGIALSDYGQYFDSISACFSKGLGCPVGSALMGSHELIDRARRMRKRLGGGMRQAGILAAAAIYALDYHIERMAEDHDHAHYLARQLNILPGVDIDMESVQTNIVFLDVAASGKTAERVVIELNARNVLAIALGPTRIRCVTHLDVNRAQCEEAVVAFKKVCAPGGR